MVAPVTEEPQQLPGGLGNQGRVVRIGDTVRRPAGPHSEAVTELLEHLRTSGFDGAPVVLGRDREGRDVDGWIDGDVPIPPFPKWALADEALISTARLIRRLHDALSDFEAPPEATWSDERSDPRGGPLICTPTSAPRTSSSGSGRRSRSSTSASPRPDGRSGTSRWRRACGFRWARAWIGTRTMRPRTPDAWPAYWPGRGGAGWFDGVTAWMEDRRAAWLEGLRA
jgi:hypothetical protein